MNRLDMYAWIASYMALTLPVGLTLYLHQVERVDIPVMYGTIAVAKVLICVFFMRKFELNYVQIALIFGAALLLRIGLNAPWMPFLIGGVIFLSAEPKKVW